MDASESAQALEKQLTSETRRSPLVPADNKNETTCRSHSRTREVSSRYRSPTASAGTEPKRCPSPNVSRTSPTSTVLAPKRAISAERKHPSRSSSPPISSPSTPVQDTSAVLLLASKKITGNKLSESLWPSTMRTLSVSFQSDAISAPTSKREKPVSQIPTDRTHRPYSKPVSHTPSDSTLRSSANITRRQAEALSSRKPTPERKRSPIKGKHSSDQSENSMPAGTLHARLVDQHRWPSRVSGKVTSTSLNRSIDLTDKAIKTSSLSHSRIAAPSLRRLSLDAASKPLQKSASDLLMLISSDDSSKAVLNRCTVDYSSPPVQNSGSSSSSDRTLLVNAAARALPMSTPGSRHPSPSVSRGVSPSRTKVPNPSSRGSSPAQSRPSSPSRQPQNSASVLSFTADIKKGKKVANRIEDVHQLRLLYNRHLQWRYAGARANAALHSQKVKTEEMLYSGWGTIVYLLDSVISKKIDLQQLRLLLKLYSVLNNQLCSLNEWASIEGDHTKSLTWTIQSLQTRTTRIPVTGRAKGDIETVKAAVFSAVDVMQSMQSICSICSQVEDMNCLITELANIAARERAMLDQCELLMGSMAAFQAEEYSLRTHILQTIRALRNGESAFFGCHG